VQLIHLNVIVTLDIGLKMMNVSNGDHVSPDHLELQGDQEEMELLPRRGNEINVDLFIVIYQVLLCRWWFFN